MFTRPDDLGDGAVARCLSSSWGLDVDELTYEAVGFGSHHWRAQAGSDDWFVTVDDLDTRLVDHGDRRANALGRLRAALSTARQLHVDGLDWVVAPIPSRNGAVIEPIDDRFVCAVYPVIAGETGSSGQYERREDRHAVVERLAMLHRADTSVPCDVDERVIPRRDELMVAIDDLDGRWTSGPFAQATRSLMSAHRDELLRALARFDELDEIVRAGGSLVVTHGEPHRANVIIAGGEAMLIDWDTVRLAPRERDLWSLVREDPTVRQVYESDAGVALDDDSLALHQLWWDLTEIALFVHEFRRPHTRTADTETAWSGLEKHLDPTRWTGLLASVD